MPPRDAVEARPRHSVDILDDAFRICFADPLLLLTLTAIGWLPVMTSIVILVVQSSDSPTVWRPAIIALLLPLTGLAAGACQEAFHSWAEDYPVRFGECCLAASRRGLMHLASQAITLLGPVAMLACLVAPNWPGGARTIGVLACGFITIVVALFSLTRQPSFAAGKPRFWRAVAFGVRATGRSFGRAVLLVSMRGVLLTFAVLNMHLYASFGLWVAENLAGFDVAFLGLLCSLGNGAYVLVLILLAWALMAPYNEAVNYLFFVDSRTRFEGLDLWERVQLNFPAKERAADKVDLAKPPKFPARVIQIGGLVLALVCSFYAAPANANDIFLPTVRNARQEISVIRGEVAAAQPFPGGNVWQKKLEELADRLEAKAPNPASLRWFSRAIQDFTSLGQPEALSRLDDIDAQLAVVEESLSRQRKTPVPDAPSRDHIKSLIPPEKQGGKRPKPKQIIEKEETKEIGDPAQPANPDGGFAKPMGPGLVAPTAMAGAANMLLVLLLGLCGAALLMCIVLVVFKWLQSRTTQKSQAKPAGLRADEHLDDPDKQDPTRLWQQADERARRGDYLGAVRTLYLAVLALLHQEGFIRYGRTRTNGEYADQLRSRALLQRPFLGLTGLFELKWYGQRACESDDYGRCRLLAEEIRVCSSAATS